MKRVLLIILAVVFLFSAYSCKGTGSETTDTAPDTTKSGDYKPFKYGIKAADYIFELSPRGIIMKYNVHNGESSYL